MKINDLINILKNQFNELNFELNDKIEFGTLTCKDVFKISKLDNQNPVELAKKYVVDINIFIEDEKLPIVAVNQGAYINIKVLDNYYQSFFENEIDNFIELEFFTDKISKKTVFEYICPNLSKPLHVGHLLQGVYGQSLVNIFKLKYQNVKTNCYLGDWGINIGITVWGWKKIYGTIQSLPFNGEDVELDLNNFEQNPIDTLVKLYVWSNQQKEKVENFNELVRIEHIKLENNDQENMQLWSVFKDKTIEYFEDVIEKLNINPFDAYDGEQSVIPYIDKLVSYLENLPFVMRENKGLYIQFDEINIEKYWPNIPLKIKDSLSQLGRAYLLESKSGYTTYILRDIAAKIKYVEENGFENFVLFVGNEQKHHYNQVFAICDLIRSQKEFNQFYSDNVANGLNYNNLSVIFNGHILTEQGKMSSRKGIFITAESVLEKVSSFCENLIQEKDNDSITKEKIQKLSISALNWFLLNKDISIDSTLKYSEIFSFTGNTGVYQLYTHSRLLSILEKNEFKEEKNFDIQYLNDLEKKILEHISILEITIEKVLNTQKIHILTKYLFDLTSLINKWYEQHNITNEQNLNRKKSLLIFVHKITKLHKALLSLIGIEVLTKI
jgi:arginyl-tRNA synthetase